MNLLPGDAWTVKPLNGIEAMRAQGWDLAHWAEDSSPYSMNTDAQIRRLAGNAFNAFPFAALLSCVIASRGLYLDNDMLSGGFFVWGVQVSCIIQKSLLAADL